jgi:hypothetical protein
LQLTIERLLTSVAERRMSDVMDQRQGFDELFIQLKGRGSRAGNLGYFNRMRESTAEMVGVAMGKHLRLPCKAPKGARMDDAIPITLKSGAIGVRIFHMLARSQRIRRIADHCAVAERSCLHERFLL